jgi:hypothetical protein
MTLGHLGLSLGVPSLELQPHYEGLPDFADQPADQLQIGADQVQNAAERYRTLQINRRGY